MSNSVAASAPNFLRDGLTDLGAVPLNEVGARDVRIKVEAWNE